MTVQSINHGRSASPLRAGVEKLGALVARIGEMLAAASDGARCGREIERLTAMSDSELARRGIRRDEIVRYAFRRHLAS